MKKKLVIIFELFFCLNLFAFIFPKDGHFAPVMEAANEGCSISIEKSKTIQTKYGKMQTANDTYIAYYPSGNIRLLYLQSPVKIKINKQNFTINSYSTTSTNGIDVPIEFFENGSLKKFICVNSVNIKRYNCYTKESTYMELDDQENIISFIPNKEISLTVNKTKFELASMYFNPSTIELFSNGNIKSMLVKTAANFKAFKLDFSKAINGPRLFVTFYETGELESLGITNNSANRPNTFSILLNENWYDVNTIYFNENGTCKQMLLCPLQEIEIVWEGKEIKFLQEHIYYNPEGQITAVVGALKYYEFKGSLDYFYENRCFLIYENGELTRLIQRPVENSYLMYLFFDEKNNPVAYSVDNRDADTIDYIDL